MALSVEPRGSTPLYTGPEPDREKGPSIKEVLVLLDGVFPMDEAVIEGEDKCIPAKSSCSLLIVVCSSA
jgi:hypothetical protein